MIIKKLYEKGKKMIVKLFCILCLLIMNCNTAYGLMEELRELKTKLHNLHQLLQQQPLQQEPPEHKRKKITPSLVTSPTPIWDEVKNLYKILENTEINGIQNQALRVHLMNFFREYNNSLNNLALFEHALQKFITFAQSKKSQGKIEEPQEFINLVEAYIELFGEEVIEYLKQQIDWITKFVHKKKLSEKDRLTAYLFVSRLSQLIDAAAKKIRNIAEESIAHASIKNLTAWQGNKIHYPGKTAQQGPRTLPDWLFHSIIHPLHVNGLSYRSQLNTVPNQIEPLGLNSGFIDRALKALKPG